MASSSQGNTVSKATKGKRKIEIKKVEQPNRCLVTFSKRKQGLFNKVTELSILSQAETALILTSPSGKPFSCGFPTPDAVIGRFLTGGSPTGPRKGKQQEEKKVETLRLRYWALEDQLQEEKKSLEEVMKEEAQKKSSSSSPLWWNLPIEEMGLECLQNFKTSIEHLRGNLVEALEKKRFDSVAPPALVVAPPPPTLSNWSFLSEHFGGQQGGGSK